MEVTYYAKQLKKITQQRNILVATILISISSNMFLGIAALSVKEHIIIVPTHLDSSIAISSNKVSTGYLEMFARDFIQTFLNTSAANEEYISRYILEVAEESNYANLKMQLAELYNEITAKQLTLQFQIQDMKVIDEDLSVQVRGLLKKRVGTKEVESKVRSYLIKFVRRGSTLKLLNFMEVE